VRRTLGRPGVLGGQIVVQFGGVDLSHPGEVVRNCLAVQGPGRAVSWGAWRSAHGPTLEDGADRYRSLLIRDSASA
jgi:hypothetical protein